MVKRLMIVLMTLLLVCSFAYAQDKEGFSVTSPMETAITAFWFPASGIYAGGVSHTFLRVGHSAVSIATLDIDATVAQEINEDKDTLAGIGAKINFNVQSNQEKGFSFLPNIGITALNNFSESKAFKDIINHYEVAIYGTLLMYRW